MQHMMFINHYPHSLVSLPGRNNGNIADIQHNLTHARLARRALKRVVEQRTHRTVQAAKAQRWYHLRKTTKNTRRVHVSDTLDEANVVRTFFNCETY